MSKPLQEKLEEYQQIVLRSTEEISELDVSCKSIIDTYLSNPNLMDSTAMIKIQAVIDYMHEQVNIGNWREVPIYLRKTITIATYLRLLAHLKCNNDLAEASLRECYKIIDFGFLFGCSIKNEPMLLQKCASCINMFNSHVNTNQSHIIKEDSTSNRSNESSYNSSINIIDCPSMEYFFKNHILAKTPVVVDNCMQHWPALQKWKDQNYLIQLAGLRTVPIEIGKQYTDQNWTQKLITIEDFIKNHIYQTNGPIGYLAQYQLFEQIPELKDDIIVPEYCCFSDSDDLVDIMAWFGPKGTVSPLHHDPKRNLLAQVVGQKEIFLFSPEDSEYLYPHEHELLNNTARVDPRQPDLEKYPNYVKAKVYHCILKEGQMLYIPPKWWHFVESLSVSFSVSFWWE